MRLRSQQPLSTLLRVAVVSALALALLGALPACRRRRVAPTATMPCEAAPDGPAIAFASAARRALACQDHEGWPLAPRIVLVRGCGRSVELFMVDEGGSLWLPIPSVTTLAEEQLSCPASQLDSVVLPGMARGVTGCGRSREFELRCRGAACSWQARGTEAHVPDGYAVALAATPRAASPVAAAPPTNPLTSATVHAPPAQPAPPPTPRPRPGEVIRVRIAGARDALQRCAWGSYTIRARWNQFGGVAFSLSEPLAGTPTELCVRTALGAEQVETDEAGELDVVVP